MLSGSAKNYYNLGGDEDKWYTSNASKTSLTAIQLFTWSKTQHSRDMMQHWSEDDGSFKSSKLSLSLSAKPKIDGVETTVGLSYEWSFTRGDDEIGSVLVQYCDPWSDGYGYQYTIAGPSGDVFFAQFDRNY